MNEIFGYVLRSKVQTNFPWANPRRWSDAPDCCGHFRRNLGDAIVYKRRSTAEQYTNLEIVPVYSDPRKTGEKSLYRANPVVDPTKKIDSELDEPR
jgi:hypothetical protein